MRALCLALLFLMTAMSPASLAQAPAAPADAAMKTFASLPEITALIAKAKAERKEGQAMVAERILIARTLSRDARIPRGFGARLGA